VKMQPFKPKANDWQKGSSLIIALVFLVVLTMLGLGVFFSTNSEEQMARNFRDQEIGLQGAEVALNEAKMRISASHDKDNNVPTTLPIALSLATCFKSPAEPGFSCDHSAYLSPFVDLFASGTPPGTDVGSYNPTGASVNPTSPTLYGVTAQPRYLIVLSPLENCSLGSGEGATTRCYKIFAQARGRLPGTRVNLVEMYTN